MPAPEEALQLTIDRLFDAPALAGPSITALKIAPDESRIAFLRGKDNDKDCLDLWSFDVRSGAAQLLVDATLLQSSGKALSNEEIARRERQRTASLTGIVEYEFSPAGDSLLLPLAGDLFFCRLATADGRPAVEPIPIAGPVTDPTISPSGTHLAYVRGQDLYVYDLESRRELPLTSDGNGAIRNGMAEFVAQEEMDRGTGYWWAPDGRHIAFARVDESPVPETLRFEVAADTLTTVAQRYPLAGSANVRVKIGIIEVSGGRTVWADLGPDADIYVARVSWLPDALAIAMQRQSRDQKRLDLLFADAATGHSRVVLTETSESWIDLHHELTFLHQQPQFIWASSRSGFMHLYLYSTDGSVIRELTKGHWNVDNFRRRAICGIDEVHRDIFFLATAASPLERQMYKVCLDSGEMEQVTRDSGLHDISMSRSTGFYVDHFHSSHQPPRTGLYTRTGALRFWLIENALDARHPSAPYLPSNATSDFGTLTSDDGQTLYYRLYKPHDFDGGKRHSAIVDVYGGPGVQRVLDSWAGSTFHQILTRAGYLVLSLDSRGSAHRGTAFQSPIQGRLGVAEVADQLVGARFLAELPFVDVDRIGVWGWSYGGYLALMLAFKAPAIFKAAISGAPVTDWRLYDTHYTERFLGSPVENPAGYDASSALTYAGRCEGPLLVIHGMADDNVLLLHSTKLFRRLQEMGKPFDVMVYPGAKHGLLRQHDGRHAYGTILRFFDRHLRQADSGIV